MDYVQQHVRKRADVLLARVKSQEGLEHQTVPAENEYGRAGSHVSAVVRSCAMTRIQVRLLGHSLGILLRILVSKTQLELPKAD